MSGMAYQHQYPTRDEAGLIYVCSFHKYYYITDQHEHNLRQPVRFSIIGKPVSAPSEVGKIDV